jgi:hypothetical protein
VSLGIAATNCYRHFTPTRFGNYEIRLRRQDVKSKAEALRELMIIAHDRRFH